MTLSLLFALAVAGLVVIVSLMVLVGWHSYRIKDMLGAFFLMWLMLTAFLVIVYFTEKKSAADSAKAKTENNRPPADSSPFSG